MKRQSFLFFGIILVFALTSCGGGFTFFSSGGNSAPSAGTSQNATDNVSVPTSRPPAPRRVSPESLPPICSCVLRFDHISIEEGLSQSSVRVVFQDSRGFLWFGTQDGLNRYDGYTFKVYKPDPDAPYSLSDRYITAIVEDKEGYLWIGTRLGGLNRYDPHTEEFTHFLHDDGNPSSINNNYINVLYLDKNDNLWIGTPRGIDLFDRVTGDFKHKGFNPLQQWDASNKNITAIYEDRIGRFWIGTADSGLGRLSSNGNALFFSYQRSAGNENETENEDVIENENTISHNYVTKIIEDVNGILWIGTRNGLNRFVPETGEFQRFMRRDRVAESITDNTINDLHLDLSGNLWVATANGLDRLDAESGTFIHYRNDPTFSKSLSDNDVLSIYEDRGGVLWFGTFGGGINKYDRQRDNFAYYRHDPSDPNTLSENYVFSIYVDSDGETWVGTHSKGLNRLNSSMDQVTRYQNNPADPNSIGTNEKILAIDEDQDGILWIGTANGLDRFDKRTSTFTHFTRDQSKPESLSANLIYNVFVDSQNDLWIGTVSGLDRLNRETGTFAHYYPETDNPTRLSGIMVYSIAEDREGNLWVGTFSNGLNKLDRKTDKFTRYRYDSKDKKSLSNDSILSIYEDTKGRLWIGTAGGGLNLYHPETDTFSYYLEKDGLPNGVVYGILEDENGYLWMSTNFGISRFDPETETFQNFDADDGLQSNEFNSAAYAKGIHGELYFGGINGLTVFHPSNINNSPYLPQVSLTSLTQDDNPIRIDSSVETAQNVTLRWPQNSLEFEFAALSYSQPNKNQYAYILEGFDTNWHFIGTKRDGRYTNLPGGQYRLLLKASNSDGVWSQTPVGINVTVIPPFWQTLWFQVVLAIIAVAAVAGGFRLRTKNIQDRNRQLERLVRERTGALEKRNQEIQALYEADERILRNVSLNQVFQTLVDVAVDMLNADRSMVFVWDEKQTKVVPLVSHGFSPESLKVMQFAKGEGLVGEVLATGRPVIVRQIEPNDFRPDVRAAIIAEGIRSFVHLPIIVDHKVVAVFNIGFTTPNLIGDDTTRLFSALTNRAAISVANMELFEQTKDLAVMEERNRLARDLHDSAKQKAFAALAQLGTARGLLNGHGNSVTMHLSEAENLVTDVIQELTFLVQEIYPIGLQEKGLVTSLREHIFEWENRNDTIIQFVTHNEQRLPLEIEQAIYRVTQEALANIARHSQARRVDVSLIYNGDSVQLSISDDGRGFDMDKKHGMGLRSIRERVSSVRGTVQIQSAPGRGTRIFVQVPTKG